MTADKEYQKISVPYIGDLEIKAKAEKFRFKYWNKKLPVDIEKITDVNLRIDIIPLQDLEKLCSANALITSDWRSLYVDQDIFEDERRKNRLRYSLAHEIGHFVLHQDFYAGLKISSFEDFYHFINLIPGEQYHYLEVQANKFASHLLVPRNFLNKKLTQEIARAEKLVNLKDTDKKLLKAYVAETISKLFGVSPEAMEIILSEFDLFQE